jgi:hypothetical protein
VKARHAPAVVVRRFAASRACSLRLTGTGAPSRRPFTLLAALAATAFAVLALGAPLASAAAPESPEVHFLTGFPTIGSSEVLVFGVLDPGQSGGGQEPLTWEFLYRQSASECTGGAATPAQNSNGEGHQEVSEFIEGLTPGTQYTVCLRAENAAAEAAVSAPLTFTTLTPAETPETTPATPVTANSAQLNGVLSPHSPEGPGVLYHFVYQASSTGCSGGNETEPSGVSAGGEAEAVSQEIEGLAPGTTYAYCLVAQIRFEAEVISAPGFFTTAAAAPSVLGGTALEVGTSTATLGAQITAAGLPTTYDVEYVTEEQFRAGGFSGAAVAPVPPAELPGSATAEPVQVTLSGLSPVTIYHFRFRAQNELSDFGPATGTEGRFATIPPAGPLPDGRAAELVSTAGIFGEPYIQTSPHEFIETGLNYSFYPFQAAADGEAVAYVGEPAETGGNGNTGAGLGEQWLATRTPEGWTTQAVGPDDSIHQAGIATYQAFSEDLSQGVLIGSANPLTPEVPVGCRALYSRATDTGAYRALFDLDESPEPGAVGPCGLPLYAGASQDRSQTIFQTQAALTPGAVRATNPQIRFACNFGCNLYDAVGGHLLPVNVLGGHPVPDASFGGFPGEAEAEHELPDLSGAISEDGSRIFWTDTEPGPDFEHVYVFEDGATNVQVSGSGPARYWTATPDGRYAYYTEEGELWRFDTDANTREALAGPGSAVLGVIGVNQVKHDEGEPDGNYLYLVAEGVPLATNQVENGDGPEEAEEGRPNLYLIHDGVTTFVAGLSSRDDEVKVDVNFGGIIGGDWKGALGLRTAAVSPDGRNLVFESGRPLTGYANTSALVPTPVREAFVYSAADGRLVCASCQPSGLSPSVHERAEAGSGEPKLPVSLESSTYIHRWMSADGNRVFFDSEQPLSPLDTNGTQDVYEWERQGEGTCTSANASPFNDGCVFLLSGGDGPGYSFLIDADEEGQNVFLEHLGPLGQVKAPAGRNELYDLRVSGGFEEAAAAACEGEACRGPLAAPPSSPSGGSSQFSHEEEPKGCKKGFVKKKGKCVRRSKTHKKKHRHHKHPRMHRTHAKHDSGGSK